MIEIRRGQAPALLARAGFSVRFRASFIDPEFRAEDQSIARVEEIAWQAYVDGRKAPLTQKAGPRNVEPSYDLSVEWIATEQRIGEARLRWADPASPSRVLLICGSARNDGTCPGEMSKSFRLLACFGPHAARNDFGSFASAGAIRVTAAQSVRPCKSYNVRHRPAGAFPRMHEARRAGIAFATQHL